MKRCGVLLVVALALSLAACNRIAPPTKTEAAEQPPTTPAKSSSPSPVKFSQHSHISSGDVPLLEAINKENEKVVSSALPSIVRVTAIIQADPHAQFLSDFPFKIPGIPHGVKTQVPAYGSGVIISRDGYIVTNNHVVDGAVTLSVQLHDQRSFTARRVATDPPSDVAVLKIDGTDFPPLPWGDSDKVEVGEQVFAIGNPFDLDDSVSKGIVSAKGRNLPNTADYEDYIQTDAAINVGNSGGALINIHGELIGLNSAIASFTRGNEGVGFSIPSNMVKNAVDQLLKNGHLVRGYLGVQLPARIDEGVVEALGIEANRGALLSGVQHSSPAEAAKLHPVDFITQVDGHRIENVPQFRLIVAQIPVGKQVAVDYIRGGSSHEAMVKIAEMPHDLPAHDSGSLPDAANSPDNATSPPIPSGNHVLNGVQVTDLDDRTRKLFGVSDMITTGVIITGVQQGTTADAKGLVRGDVVEVACAQHGAVEPMGTPADFAKLVTGLKPDQNVVLLIHHGKTAGSEEGTSSFVYLTPPK